MSAIIEILAIHKGHEEIKLPDDPKEAKTKVAELQRAGYSLYLKDNGTDKKIKNLDETTGEWIVSETIEKETRFPLKDSVVTAIAPVAGG